MSIAVSPAIDPGFYAHVGYVVRGPRAIRGDVLARLADATIAGAASGDAEARAELCTRLGVRRRDLDAVLRALGA
ncbi:MAG: hypothetical protein JNK45_04505 [Myxococcales bacterium]|nr:hypothetical protein [Myxococcales bacterium]